MIQNIERLIFSVFIVLLIATNSWAWSSKTHIFIAQEAGINNPQAACFPDLSKKENDPLLGPYHWHSASPNTVVTPDYIDRYQITEDQYIKVGSPGSKPKLTRMQNRASRNIYRKKHNNRTVASQ